MNLESIEIYVNDKESITIKLNNSLFDILRKIEQLKEIRIEEKTFFSLIDFLEFEAYPINYISIKRCKVLGSDPYIHINLGKTIIKFYKEQMSIDFFIKSFDKTDKKSTITIDGIKRNLYNTLTEFCTLMIQPEEYIELDNTIFFNRLRYNDTLEIDLKMKGILECI